MQLATRWLGAGSIVVGVVAAAALAVSLIPREPERLSWEDAHWREYTWMLYSSCEEGDVRYEHSLRQIGECLSRSSGWAHSEPGPRTSSR